MSVLMRKYMCARQIYQTTYLNITNYHFFLNDIIHPLLVINLYVLIYIYTL